MAVTITQQPTSPNAAYTRLPYVVSGSVTVNNPQYQYVMDIYESGSSDLITRITQTKNPNGVAVFDPSRIFQGELGQDDNWSIVSPTSAVNSTKAFEVKFGEQYGTSPSSSITVYPDLDSTEIVVWPSVVDPNNGVSFNFDTTPYNPSNIPDELSLSTYPYRIDPDVNNGIAFQWLSKDDYQTMSALKESDWEITGIYFSGTRENDTAFNLSIQSGSILPDLETGVFYVPSGPKNLSLISPTLETFFNGNWSAYLVVIETNSTRSIADYYANPNSQRARNNIGQSISFYEPANPCEDYVRFAFINKNGVWDFYNVYNPVRRQSDIERQSVTLPQVDYSSITSPYNVNRRGQKDYYTQVKDVFEVTTDSLEQDISNWLEEMLDSPSVYVQRGNCFIPVIITNSQYQHNNSTSRNKLFQYTITFEPANQPYGDWDQIPTACQDTIQRTAQYTTSITSSGDIQFTSNGLPGLQSVPATSQGFMFFESGSIQYVVSGALQPDFTGNYSWTETLPFVGSTEPGLISTFITTLGRVGTDPINNIVNNLYVDGVLENTTTIPQWSSNMLGWGSDIDGYVTASSFRREFIFPSATPTPTPTDTPTPTPVTPTPTPTDTPTPTPTPTPEPIYYRFEKCDESGLLVFQTLGAEPTLNDRYTNGIDDFIYDGVSTTLPGPIVTNLTYTGQTGCPSTPTATPVTPTPTPSPTPTPTPTPEPSTYYARFITCGEPEGAIIQVQSSSPISTSIVLEDTNECYEWFSTGGTGVDGDISTFAQYADCATCQAALTQTYFLLYNCDTEVINQRTDLPTGSYAGLSGGDRVTNGGGTVTYTIQGTTTNNAISSTSIIDTGLIGCPITCQQLSGVYGSTISAEDAYCTTTKLSTAYFNESTLADSTVVYGDSGCSTVRAVDTWYSDQIGLTRFWDASAGTLTTITNPSCP